MNPIRIRFDDLPARPRQLDPREFSAVFGGCGSKDYGCRPNGTKSACCPGLTCTYLDTSYTLITTTNLYNCQ
jgi:hypothetical protein